MSNVQTIVSQLSTMFDAARDQHESGQNPATLGDIVKGIAENTGTDESVVYQIAKLAIEKRSDLILVKGRNGGVCSKARMAQIQAERDKQARLLAAEKAQREAQRKERETKKAQAAVKREAQLAKADMLDEARKLLAG